MRNALSRIFFFLFPRRRCPICGNRTDSFLPGGAVARVQARCPKCGSLERQRFLYVLLSQRTDLLNSNQDVLHFAPEDCLRARFRAVRGWRYVTTDLRRSRGDVCSDITRLSFADNVFDLVICSHVLQFVKDDRAAMAELCRIVKPDGVVFIIVPPLISERTLEDGSADTPEKRRALFGHKDFLRKYGLDIQGRLETAGFSVAVINCAEGVTPGLRLKYALLSNEAIVICRKMKCQSRKVSKISDGKRIRAVADS